MTTRDRSRSNHQEVRLALAGVTRFRARAFCLRPRFVPSGSPVAEQTAAEHVGPLAEAFAAGRFVTPGSNGWLKRIETGPIHHGNQVQLFFRGEEAFASVLQAIEGATQEILLGNLHPER